MTWYSQCYCFFIFTIFVSGNIRTPETDVHKEDKAHPPVIVFDMKQRNKNTHASLKWMLLTVSDKNQGINTDKDFLNDYILCKSTESQNHKSPSIFTEKKRFREKTDSQQWLLTTTTIVVVRRKNSKSWQRWLKRSGMCTVVQLLWYWMWAYL